MPQFESKVILSLITAILEDDKRDYEERTKMVLKATKPFIKELRNEEEDN